MTRSTTSPRRARRSLPPSVYIFGVVLIAILTGTSIVWLEHYSDHEARVESALGQIQACSYHLSTIEETACANRHVDSRLKREFADVDAEINREIAVIGANGETDTADAVTRMDVSLNTSLWSEFKKINKRVGLKMQAAARDRVDVQFNTFNQELSLAAADVSSRTDNSNTVALVGTILLMSLGSVIASVIFRQFARSQQSITQLATKQATLEEGERRFRILMQNALDLIFIASSDGTIISVVAAGESSWFHDPALLLNTSMYSLVNRHEASQFREYFEHVSKFDGDVVQGELLVRHGDGSFRPSEVVFTNLNSEPGIDGVVVNCRDISERKAVEAKMSHLAFHDPLTDLPNRALFMERLTHGLARSKRTQDRIAVIFLDLDNFKIVNDSLGHEAGDTLLKAVASRLMALLRPGDTVARLGGDEFTILLEDIAGDAEAIAVAERITNVLSASITIDQREVFVNASMGIALNTEDVVAAEDILRDADTAMYHAKTSSKGHSVVFNSNMNLRAVERLEIETDLHSAIANDEFRVYYQPILSIDSREIMEMEALIRWEHPTRGLVMPSAFITIAEESGLIVALGEWILEKACSQVVQWHRESPEKTPLTISVNLSVRQLHEPDLVERVQAILEKVGMDPHYLKLEVTESVMLRDPSNVTEKLEALKALGIRISVDDFGTGYSSMSYLSGLPIDTLKIDRSFISKMSQSEGDESIVRAIVTLAKALNLKITAEGIETLDQLERLQSLDCDQGQGYLYSRPLSVADMSAILANEEPSLLLTDFGDDQLPIAA